jgi:hypothetical protein
MTHTPAPWKYDKGLGCKPIKGGKHGTHRQAQYTEIAYTTGLYDEDEDEANARMIASSPEMFDLLGKCLIDFEEVNPQVGGAFTDLIEEIKQTLASVKGKQE